MIKQKSKILKLKKEQDRLKSWKKYGGWILLANALISISIIPICVMAPVGLVISLSESAYFCLSILAFGAHDLFGEKKLQEKIGDIDQEILELVKTDAEEFEILKEYDKIQTIEREIHQKETAKREQKRLVEKLIAKKNLKANAQQNYIKELTKKYEKQAMENKATARERAIKDVENLNDGDFLINQ